MVGDMHSPSEPAIFRFECVSTMEKNKSFLARPGYSLTRSTPQFPGPNKFSSRRYKNINAQILQAVISHVVKVLTSVKNVKQCKIKF